MNAVWPACLSASAVFAATMGIRRQGGGATVRSSGVLRWAFGRRLARSLERAGLPVGPHTFLAGVIGSAAGLGAAVMWVLGTPVAGLMIALMVGGAATGYIRSSERRYLQRLAGQMPLVAQQLAGGLGAGLSLRQAIERMHNEVAEPAAGEFAWVAAQLRLGGRLDDVLDRFVERVREPGVQMLVTAVLIQRTVGGNLALALARLAGQLDDRDRLVRETRTATAQARMSAWLVAGLPAVGGIAVELAAPGTLQRTLGQGAGRVLLVAALLLEFIGVVLVRRIVATVAEGITCQVR